MKVNINSSEMTILNKFSSTLPASTRSNCTNEDIGQLVPKLVSMVTTLFERSELDRKEIELLKKEQRGLRRGRRGSPTKYEGEHHCQ